MSPIICRWKLLKLVDCFGDKKNTREIKLCVYGLKASCVTLFHYSISYNFPALRGWNKKCEAKLKKS